MPTSRLVLDRGVAVRLGGEFLLLQASRVCGHAVVGVPARQLEHRVVQRVEAGEGDELEHVLHHTALFEEHGDRGVIEVLAPVGFERRAVVDRRFLVEEVALVTSANGAGHLEVPDTDLHPEQLGVRGVSARRRAMHGSMPFHTRSKPSAVRSPVMNGRSRSSQRRW